MHGALSSLPSRSEPDVVPGRHVEMKVIGVVVLAWSNHDPKHVVTCAEASGQLAQEACMHGDARVQAVPIPVRSDLDLKGAPQRLGQPGRERLLFRGGAKFEASDIERVPERVFTQAIAAMA